MDAVDAVDAVVDYHAESRSGAHVLDVAARSETDGVLQVELTVSDPGGQVLGEGALRLTPEVLPPTERVLAQVLRGLAQLHTLPDRTPRPPEDRRPGRPNARRPWSPDEEDRLRAAWDRGDPVATVAVAHGRSGNAIRSRLLKLGLITLDHPDAPADLPGLPRRERSVP